MSSALVAEYLIVATIITIDEVKKEQRVPLPSRYVQSTVAFGILGVASAFIGTEIAAVFGAGLILALLYKTFAPTDNTVGGDAGKALGGAIDRLAPTPRRSK